MVRYDLNLFEVWKPIPGYEGMYDVSTEGRVWSHKTNRILKQSPNQKGYYRVKMEGKSMAVARLVCMTFNQNPDPEHLTEVNHINEDKRDNRFCNLEWCDRKYNVNYGTGTQRRLKKAYESGRANPAYEGLSEKERRRQYKQDHKEKVKEYKKNNYMKNRDYYLAYYKQWRQNKIKSDYELS